MSRWTSVSAAALAAALTVLAGCSGFTADRSPLPPPEIGDLRPLFADELTDLGLELTERGGLIDRSDGYEVSEVGGHLALYVVPIEEPTDDQYVDGIVEVTRAVADAFERWPDLDSLDVCQERHPSDPQRDRQLTVTQIELTRDTAASIDWDTVTLGQLLIMLEDDPDSFLRISNDLATHPDVRSAVAELREATGEAGATLG